MKVCLIYPGSFFTCANDVSVNFNQQLFYLYSYLREHAPEIEVEILDLRRENSSLQDMDVDGFLHEAELLLARSGFDVVGISCWTTYSYPSSLEVAKLCKQLNPECTVIVGGYHPTFVPEDFIYPDSPFDYVVKGEGEKALLDIVTGKIPKEQPVQVVQGTALPIEAHKLRWGECKYHRNMEVMTVWLSRGCPFACVFCADRLTNYRYLSPQDSIAEIKQILQVYPQVTHIQFWDPLFGIRKDWRREFLALLRDADLPVYYWAETRVDLLEQADVELIAQLPFRLSLGLESVVPEILAIMKKTTDPQKYVQRCFELDTHLNRLKVPHVYNHIYNHPGETSQTLRQSLGFWQEYYRGIDRDLGGRCYTDVSGHLFMLMPGSEVYYNWDEYAQKYGCSVANRNWWRQTDYPIRLTPRDVLGSRELAESGGLDLPSRTAEQLAHLSISHMDIEAFKPHIVPFVWESGLRYGRAVQGAKYFDDKPLRLHPRAAIYPQEDGNTLLFSFANRQSRPLSPTGMKRLRSLLDGATVAMMVREMGQDAGTEEQRAHLRRFISDLLAGGFLMVGYQPGQQTAAPQPRVRLRTSAGTMEVELFADQAPLLAANFLYLVQQGYYDGLYFDLQYPSACVEVGNLAPYAEGPGYTLPPSGATQPVTAGTLAMVREGSSLHGSRIQLYRGAAESEAAFGRVVAGIDVLQSLLIGDYVRAATVMVDAPGVQDPQAAESANRA